MLTAEEIARGPLTRLRATWQAMLCALGFHRRWERVAYADLFTGRTIWEGEACVDCWMRRDADG